MRVAVTFFYADLFECRMGFTRRGVIVAGGAIGTVALGEEILDRAEDRSEPTPTHRTVEHVTVPTDGMSLQPFEIPTDAVLHIEIEPTADVDAWVAERHTDNPAKSLASVGCQASAGGGDRAAAECQLPSGWYNVVLQSGEGADVRLVIELYPPA